MTKTFSRVSLGTFVVGVMVVAVAFAAAMAHADAATVVTSAIRDAGNVSIASAPIGAVVHDSVVVATTTASTTPTGTVDFNRYSNISCSGTPTTEAGIVLISGAANSGTTTVPTTGLSYTVHYNGDATNTPATGACEVLAATTTPPATVGTIGGVVFNDQNNNGTKDGSEAGLAGFVINLHQGSNNAAPIVMSATTSASGTYSFGSLALGTYYVEEVNMSGWTQTSSDTAVTLSASNLSGSVNFGNMTAASSTGNGHKGGNNEGDNGHGQDNQHGKGNQKDNQERGNSAFGHSHNLLKWFGKKDN